MAEQGLNLVIKATDFAARAHRCQMRKDGSTPYINHPIGVANILCEIAKIYDPNVLAAALLHDTVEDTDTTFEDIENSFGHKIRSIVEELTDDKSLPKLERKRLQVINAPKHSHEAKLIKLADKMYNLKDILRKAPIGWDDERCQKYFEWSAMVISGMIGTNEALESELRRILSLRNVSLTDSIDYETLTIKQ